MKVNRVWFIALKHWLCETGRETLERVLSDKSLFQLICICVVAAGLCCLTPHKQAGLKPHVRAWKSCPSRAPALQSQRKCRKLGGIFDSPVATRQSVRHNDQTTVVSRWPSGIREIGSVLWPLGVNYSQACLCTADNWPGRGDKAKERLGTMKKGFKFACVCVCTYRFFLAKVFVWSDVQLQRSGCELIEGRSELKAVLEEWDPSKDVQAQSGSWHGYHQTPHIPVK